VNEVVHEIVHEVSDNDYRVEDPSSSTARRQEFKLTLCEFENIAQRYESSLPILLRVADVLDTKENFKAMREKVNHDSEQITLKVDVSSHFKSRYMDRIATEIYKVKLHDIDRRAFLMVKTDKARIKEFTDHVIIDSTYVFDRIKLQVNTRGELVLTTTSSTVFREESEDSEMSLELSQKQRDYSAEKRWKSRAPLKNVVNIETAIQNLQVEEAASKSLAYIVKGDSGEINDPPLLGSAKHIWNEAQKMLADWAS
jgi:hypothetical protein